MLIKHFRKTWKQPELSFFAFCKEFRIQFISLTILENYSLFANQTKKNMRLKNWTALSPETNMLLYFCQFLNIPISDQDFAFLFSWPENDWTHCQEKNSRLNYLWQMSGIQLYFCLSITPHQFLRILKKIFFIFRMFICKK